MPKNTVDVLIIGAGPVGLFCANELIRHGLSCRIIDKHPGVGDKSKALGLHIRTLDVADDTGFTDAIMERGLKIAGVTMTSNGQQVLKALFSDAKGNRDYAIDIPQNETEAVFYDGLKAKGGDVEWETELTDIFQNDENVTAVVTKSNGKVETITVPWVIACDGSHSTVREKLQMNFVGSEYKEVWWLADLHIDWGNLSAIQAKTMHVYLNNDGPLACFPMKNNRYRIVMVAPTTEIEKEPTMEDIVRVFNQRVTDAATLTDPVWLAKFTIHHRQIQQYRKGRVFFAGDAAHIHSPMAGQGLNTGVQDTYNLAWKLALVHKKMAKEILLDSYHVERYSVGRDVLKKTDKMTKAILLKNPVAIFLRNLMLSTLSSLSFVRHRVVKNISQLAISYAKSPIVSTLGRAQRLKAGEFFSDFNLLDPVTNERKPLHTVLQGITHHLFLFEGLQGTGTATLVDIANMINKKYPNLIDVDIILSQKASTLDCKANVWFDEQRQVHRQYKITEPTAILFRPDKYIGMTQTPLDSVEIMTYIKEILL